jgi:hypothetical protein
MMRLPDVGAGPALLDLLHTVPISVCDLGSRRRRSRPFPTQRSMSLISISGRTSRERNAQPRD